MQVLTFWVLELSEEVDPVGQNVGRSCPLKKSMSQKLLLSYFQFIFHLIRTLIPDVMGYDRPFTF